MTQKPRRILGVDPGLGTTGYALLSLPARAPEPLLVEGGILRSDARAPFERRLCELFQDLTRLIRGLRPDVMAVENLYSHYKHPRTSIIMGHARGVIFLAAALAKVPVQSYAATEIKKSLVGAGRATKRQIQQMVQRRLGLAEPPEPDDLADAIAAAYCHVDRALRRGGLPAGRARR
ncbi:MAG: crossover junction endodeoxyribonuclease RuvC [Nitrospinota bacterium]